ncbi:MAG: hypothetical protein EOM08_02690 [Clostridia bacterium]|nr:hypothetical protein [Clostridia bacterium]NCC75324.1 hypothetical protein [Clostridia bacterium]
MKRKLILVIVLLCVSSLMASMAYNTATVTNAAELKITNTNTALLALVPLGGIGNLDQTAYLDGGDLVFEFGRGNNPWFGGDQNYGLQRNSVYEWFNGGASNTGMFAIQNRSAEHIRLSIKVTGVPAGVTIETNQSMGDGGNGWQNATGSFVVLPRTLTSGSTCDIGVRITVGDTAVNGLSNMEVVIKAEAIA